VATLTAPPWTFQFTPGADTVGNTVTLVARGQDTRGSITDSAPVHVRVGVQTGSTVTPYTTPVSAFGALGDDTYAQYNFQSGFRFPFYGALYDHMYVGTNGYLTFVGPDSSLGGGISYAMSSSLPRILWMFADMYVQSGEVFVDQTADRVIVTWV